MMMPSYITLLPELGELNSGNLSCNERKKITDSGATAFLSFPSPRKPPGRCSQGIPPKNKAEQSSGTPSSPPSPPGKKFLGENVETKISNTQYNHCPRGRRHWKERIPPPPPTPTSSPPSNLNATPRPTPRPRHDEPATANTSPQPPLYKRRRMA